MPAFFSHECFFIASAPWAIWQNGETCLHQAASQDNVDVVRVLLADSRVNLHIKSKVRWSSDRCTPNAYALFFTCAAVQFGGTPLDYAIGGRNGYGCPEVVALLKAPRPLSDVAASSRSSCTSFVLEPQQSLGDVRRRNTPQLLGSLMSSVPGAHVSGATTDATTSPHKPVSQKPEQRPLLERVSAAVSQLPFWLLLRCAVIIALVICMMAIAGTR